MEIALSPTFHAAAKAQATEYDQARYRHKRGQCSTCGIQTHKVLGLLNYSLVPLAIPGHILNGRCLLCKPLPASASAPPHFFTRDAPPSRPVTGEAHEESLLAIPLGDEPRPSAATSVPDPWWERQAYIFIFVTWAAIIGVMLVTFSSKNGSGKLGRPILILGIIFIIGALIGTIVAICNARSHNDSVRVQKILSPSSSDSGVVVAISPHASPSIETLLFLTPATPIPTLNPNPPTQTPKPTLDPTSGPTTTEPLNSTPEPTTAISTLNQNPIQTPEPTTSISTLNPNPIQTPEPTTMEPTPNPTPEPTTAISLKEMIHAKVMKFTCHFI
mmetsp:Transcript_31642/g.66554  ORF Transcript_31642/g.66554 Transcript_31642/m.66554 type:complete len:330 (+) Transcript_31642:104-1093(+)